MSNIREVVSNNILKLRKANNLTQIELAKKVNFSDKAVSRWEKGEVLPDLETLEKLSEVFNVPLSQIIEPQSKIEQNKTPTKNEMIFQALLICILWTFCTVFFIYLFIIEKTIYWQVFTLAIPITLSVVLIANRRNGNFVFRTIMLSFITWTALSSIYLHFLHLNLWLIFLIGVPIQAAIISLYFIYKPKTEKVNKTVEDKN